MSMELAKMSHKAWCRSSRLPLRRFALLLVALLSVCVYPVFFVYFHNIKEAAFAQIFTPILISSAIGLGAWLVFAVLSGEMAKGALTALLFMLVFMNYTMIDDSIRRILPDWRWWRIAPTFLFLFINMALALRIFATRAETDGKLMKITAAIGSAFLALILFNAAIGIYTLARTPQVRNRSVVSNTLPKEGSLAVRSVDKWPNFYFFIFDEYARQDMLKKFTGYDNLPFLKKLERKMFNVSYSSYSSSSSTNVSVGNSLNYSIKYKIDDETRDGIARPPLFELFKKARYKIYSLSPIYKFDKDLVDVELKSTTILEALSIEKTVMAGSFMAYLQRHGNEDYRADRLSLLKQAFDIAKESSENPKFVFFHILCPHESFVFDENGDPVVYENMKNWADTRYYTGQLRFISKKIDELTDTILEKDPDAVVLLQSDHGARYFNGSYNLCACFNCLYLRGKDVGIEGLSAINTLRLALNHALGLKLDILGD